MADGFLAKLAETLRDRAVDVVLVALLSGLPWTDRFAIGLTEAANPAEPMRVEIESTSKTIKHLRLRVRAPKGAVVTAQLAASGQVLQPIPVSEPDADAFLFGAGPDEEINLNPLESIAFEVSASPGNASAAYTFRLTGEDFGTSKEQVQVGVVAYWLLVPALALRIAYAVGAWYWARRSKSEFERVRAHYRHVAASVLLRERERARLVHRILPSLEVYSRAMGAGRARLLASVAADRVIDRAQDPAEDLEQIIDRCTREVVAEEFAPAARRDDAS